MGRTACRQLAAMDDVAELVVADRDEAGAALVARSLAPGGARVTSRGVDLTDPTATRALVAGALARGARPRGEHHAAAPLDGGLPALAAAGSRPRRADPRDG
jgi:hypothetical protein